MRRALLGCALTAVWCSLALAGTDEGASDPWTPEQGAHVVARLADREAFVGSREARRHPESLNLFFRGADYEGLRGNPVFGYWSEGHFRWKGTHVAWDGITPATGSAAPITRGAWTTAFAYVAKKHGLVLDRQATIRVRGACLAAVLNPTVGEPNRGVVLEIRIDSPTGPFRYRFGMGKPTIEDAVGASLDWAVSFALTVNRDQAPKE
jgi:hypothetical protein